MNCGKLIAWGEKYAKRYGGQLWQEFDESYSIVDSYSVVGYNVKNVPSEFATNNFNKFSLLGVIEKYKQDNLIQIDGSHLYNIKIRECPLQELADKTKYYYVTVENDRFNARLVKKAIEIMGKDCNFYKDTSKHSPLLIVDEDGNRCIIYPIIYHEGK